MARAGPVPRGARRGRRSQLCPPGWRSLRPDVLSGWRGNRARHIPGGGRLFSGVAARGDLGPFRVARPLVGRGSPRGRRRSGVPDGARPRGASARRAGAGDSAEGRHHRVLQGAGRVPGGGRGQRRSRPEGVLMRRFILSLIGLIPAATLAAQDRPAYLVGVVSESGDIVTWLKPVPGGKLEVQRVVPVGIMPADIDGPHNITVAPDQKSYYITIAHGVPFGTLWRLDAATDTVIGRAQVELFPTTVTLSPDGEWAYVANSDFHGERPRVNPVSIIHAPTMTKVTDLTACDMPHGVKVNHAGTKVYVSCMHSDEILELDPGSFDIVRRVKLGMGHQMPAGAGGHSGHGPPGAGAPAGPPRKGEDVQP